jgi:ankyrin repeat protein
MNELIEICKVGNIELLKALLKENENIDINISDNFGLTGFHYACNKGYTDILNLLIEKGCNINILDNDGWTGFNYSCRNGHFHIVQLLINKVNDINMKSYEGRNSFHFACLRNHIEVSLLLIKHGVNVYTKNNFGDTGLDLYGFHSQLALEEKICKVSVLADAYKIEWNWRRRKYFIKFLQGSNFLEIDNNNNNNNNNNINSIFTIQEKVFCLRPFYESITSFL